MWLDSDDGRKESNTKQLLYTENERSCYSDLFTRDLTAINHVQDSFITMLSVFGGWVTVKEEDRDKLEKKGIVGAKCVLALLLPIDVFEIQERIKKWVI